MTIKTVRWSYIVAGMLWRKSWTARTTQSPCTSLVTLHSPSRSVARLGHSIALKKGNILKEDVSSCSSWIAWQGNRQSCWCSCVSDVQIAQISRHPHQLWIANQKSPTLTVLTLVWVPRCICISSLDFCTFFRFSAHIAFISHLQSLAYKLPQKHWPML